MSGSGDGSRTTPVVAPAPLPADVGLVFALPIEAGPMLRKLRDVRKYSNERLTVIEGELGGKLVAVVITGSGRKRALHGAQLLLAGHKPRWVISAGFGGALTTALARNDVVFAQEVSDEEGRSLAIDVTVHSDAGGPGPRLRSGKLLTVDHIVRSAAEKAELHARFGAHVVDMESVAVAALCAERGVRFMAIRVVSDDAQTNLPKEVVSILGRSGGYRVGAAVGAIWRRPGSLKDLWRLRDHAVAAAEVLGDVIPDAVARLG
jgi:adenosylhomocysteine nucleosidase